MFLTEPLPFEEIEGIRSREEISKMSEDEKRAYDVKMQKALHRNIINHAKVIFKLGMLKRLEDGEPQAGSWESHKEHFTIENRNKFGDDDITIMNTIVRLTQVDPTGKIMEMHLISAVSGYLISEGIQAVQIKWMLDTFLKKPLDFVDEKVVGICLFWDN